jgi:dienelactone hydrolase
VISAEPAAEVVYLEGAPDPTFATLHRPAAATARDTAVILCPPFGWDEVCSYRSLRFWATQLARAGYPAVRISLPSTGDSGGNAQDPDRYGAWVAALTATVDWLRATTGAQRVAAIGIALGGAIVVSGAQDGARIDDLVLWGIPAGGRSLVRQLRVFARLETSQFYAGLEPPPPSSRPAGELEAGGFLLSAETVRRLEELELDAGHLPVAPGRRALMLERDGLGVDAQLCEGLERAGIEVSSAPGDGYGAMTSHPQRARPPLAVIERVEAWLGDASARADAALIPPSRQPARAKLTPADGATITETTITIPQSFGSLSGVLVEPAEAQGHRLCAVLLNAGAVRRIGPSRMWVEAARRWAARGVPTLRLDFEGIGDADGDEGPYREDGALYVPRLIPQVLAALDHLQEQGVGDRFVMAGLCAGAYWSFHAALRDPRVTAAFMINPRALIWEEGLGPARDFRALLTQRPSLTKLRRLATGPRLRAFLRWGLAAPGRWLARLRSHDTAAALAQRDLDVALEQFAASDTGALLLFSAHEPLYDELRDSGRLARLDRLPQVTIEQISVRDHTLRPTWAQQRAHELLDQALERELQVASAATA